tara:strand:- start:341 stop:955 length:615 start_codon:yes stop_codon:yes gene_type:complete
MYGGFDVYKTYLAVKLHFTSKSYDYHKYDGKINCKLDTFTKRNDRYFFHKLSIKYKQEEILDFFVSNFIKDEKKWVGSLLRNDGQDIYLDYKKRQDSFKYHFRNDLLSIHNDFNANNISFDVGFLCDSGQHPRLLRLLLQKKTSIQTIVVLNEILSFTKNWDKEVAEKVVWPKISSTITKLRGFMKYNKTECKLIVKEVFSNDN